ncbi:MAG: NlpC/P60 family protein [Coriobacteriia bacterium]|nr:NlpC/P60 family protein [Coriobacteriia bacterium]
MHAARIASLARRATALATVAALLCAVPAFAEPVATATPDPAPEVTTPTKPATPAKPANPAPADPAPTRKPPARGSELNVATDGETEEFRAELAERQKRLDEFMAQLDALDRELEIASEAYNQAVDRLSEMKQRVVTAEVDLGRAQEAYDLQSIILGERAESIYKDGSLAAIEVLLDSKSVADLMSRVKFLNTIGIRDAEIAASLNGQKDLLESQVAALHQSQDVARSLEFELKARQIEVMIRIQERQQMLADAKTDLLELLDSEAARRSIEESELLAQVLSSANDRGIVVTPGSPVETALAYHGVPYLWGGEKPSGFDCSGLVLYVFRQHGVKLPHYSGSQFLLGEKVVAAALAPGDVVFFGSPIHHVGIYVGGGYYIHAPRTGDFVKISKLADRRDFAGARRYPWNPRTAAPTGARVSPTAALGNLAR